MLPGIYDSFNGGGNPEGWKNMPRRLSVIPAQAGI